MKHVQLLTGTRPGQAATTDLNCALASLYDRFLPCDCVTKDNPFTEKCSPG